MAIHSFGGGGGPLPVGEHATDGDTVRYFPLDGTGTGLIDTIASTRNLGSAMSEAKAAIPSPYAGVSGMMTVDRASTPLLMDAYDAAMNPAAGTPLTVAGIMFQSSRKAGVGARDIVRHERTGFGSSSFRFSLNTENKFWVGRETPAGWQAYGSTILVPQDQWVHFAVVFRTDDDVTVYLNGSANKWTANFTSGYNAADTASRICVGYAGDKESAVGVHSLIFKNIQASDAQVDAMYAEFGGI